MTHLRVSCQPSKGDNVSRVLISDVAIGLAVIDGLIKDDVRTLRRLEQNQRELADRINQLRARISDNATKLNRLYESGRNDLALQHY